MLEKFISFFISDDYKDCVWAGLKGARSVHLFQSGSDGRSLVPLQDYINIIIPHKLLISAVFESLSVVFGVNKLTSVRTI